MYRDVRRAERIRDDTRKDFRQWRIYPGSWHQDVDVGPDQLSLAGFILVNGFGASEERNHHDRRFGNLHRKVKPPEKYLCHGNVYTNSYPRNAHSIISGLLIISIFYNLKSSLYGDFC